GAQKGNPVIGPLSHTLKIKLAALGASQKVSFFIAQFSRADLSTLRDMIEAGKIKPVVEKIYPLKDTAKAMYHLGTGHAQGKIVLAIR
ncbi:MAG: zinc-binding dehydrogenase, partial [Anaerolineales bacterium]|nr:zinc-binding dehydrogenase [Anaerolineales bacterium]